MGGIPHAKSPCRFYRDATAMSPADVRRTVTSEGVLRAFELAARANVRRGLLQAASLDGRDVERCAALLHCLRGPLRRDPLAGA